MGGMGFWGCFECEFGAVGASDVGSARQWAFKVRHREPWQPDPRAVVVWCGNEARYTLKYMIKEFVRSVFSCMLPCVPHRLRAAREIASSVSCVKRVISYSRH